MKIERNKPTKSAGAARPAESAAGAAAAKSRPNKKSTAGKTDAYRPAGHGSQAQSQDAVLEGLVQTRRSRKAGKPRPERPATLTPERRQAILKAFDREYAAGRCEWKAASAVPSLGAESIQVPLRAERHVDGFEFHALFPAGTDPNQARSYYVQRSGGFAGLRQIAGPFPMPGAASAD
jgi:hypothetical protein